MRTTLLALSLLLFAACAGDNRTVVAPGAYASPDGGAPGCLPDLDGKIDANELQPAFGIPVSFLVSPAGGTRAVDLVGRVDGAGQRVWDWSAPAGDDAVVRFAAHPASASWYASKFPGDAFAAPADAAQTVDAVYRHDDAAVWLLGVASAAESPPEGQTLMVYSQPVALYPFPLQPGAHWVSVGQVVNATFHGLPYAGRDTYDMKVDAAGRLELPDLTFTQALRVRLALTVEPAVGAPVTRRETQFLFECFGEVARATSADGETNEDFTTAAEVRRFGLE